MISYLIAFSVSFSSRFRSPLAANDHAHPNCFRLTSHVERVQSQLSLGRLRTFLILDVYKVTGGIWLVYSCVDLLFNSVCSLYILENGAEYFPENLHSGSYCKSYYTQEVVLWSFRHTKQYVICLSSCGKFYVAKATPTRTYHAEDPNKTPIRHPVTLHWHWLSQPCFLVLTSQWRSKRVRNKYHF